MKTKVVSKKSITRTWVVVDAADQVLGRLASNVARTLMGKGKVAYSPNQDHGDHVIVVNSDKVKLTGTKADTKYYWRASSYPGASKARPYREQMARDSTRVIRHAIHGMLPKAALGKSIMKKLRVYKGPDHPHAAQQPAAAA